MDELLNMINKLYPSEITCVVVNEKEERPPPLSDSTFLTILTMADSLVNVHVKDGSIYSGLFRTTYVQGQFSVVLKQAMITKKGKSSRNNVGKEALADPLVIPSNDLVKVVAKFVSGRQKRSLMENPDEETDGISGNHAPKELTRLSSNGAKFVDEEYFQPPSSDVHSLISEDPRFFPYFKDCVGAIDAGWEGSATNLQVFNSAFTRKNRLQVPEGKYYLVDNKYPNVPGFIAPYPRTPYHFKDFPSGYHPQNAYTEYASIDSLHVTLNARVQRQGNDLAAKVNHVNVIFRSFSTSDSVFTFFNPVTNNHYPKCLVCVLQP
ncbi:hypothetical protein P8452_55964 [Trifolium repens]|nr:hypothetical protein P8452_55964 [Trifolium repens]